MDASDSAAHDSAAAPSDEGLASPTAEQAGGADAGLSAAAWMNADAPAGAVRAAARAAGSAAAACAGQMQGLRAAGANRCTAACRQAGHEDEDDVGLCTQHAGAVAMRSVPGAAAPPPAPAAAAPPPPPAGEVWAVCQARAVAPPPRRAAELHPARRCGLACPRGRWARRMLAARLHACTLTPGVRASFCRCLTAPTRSAHPRCAAQHAPRAAWRAGQRESARSAAARPNACPVYARRGAARPPPLPLDRAAARHACAPRVVSAHRLLAASECGAALPQHAHRWRACSAHLRAPHVILSDGIKARHCQKCIKARCRCVCFTLCRFRRCGVPSAVTLTCRRWRTRDRSSIPSTRLRRVLCGHRAGGQPAGARRWRGSARVRCV
jgi:hypothetical protein